MCNSIKTRRLHTFLPDDRQDVAGLLPLPFLFIFGTVNDQEIYLSAFGEVLLFITGGILFILVAFFTSGLLRPNRPNTEKLSTYESGEEAIGAAWAQFNVRFYIIALIFLLFEVEILFLFPWATVFANKELLEETNGIWGWFSVIEVVIFIAILALGLAYAWVHGHLDWIKPQPSPTKVESPVPANLYEKINEQYRAGPAREAHKDENERLSGPKI